MHLFTSACLVLTLAATPIAATETCQRDAMVVFDGSGSMAEMGFNQIGEPRIFEARRAIRESMPQIAPVRRLGLIVYGPGGADACSGLDLRFAPVADAAALMIDAIDALQPEGETALTDAVQMAADVLEYRVRPATVVLVTDGRETCGGAPCQLAAELRADAVDITVHVIGFKVRGEFFSWEGQGAIEYNEAISTARCLAEDTGGSYFGAETIDDLVTALRVTLGCNVLF